MDTPQFLFIEMTPECNLRCRMCHCWRTKEGTGSLTTSEKVALVHSFADWAGRGAVVLTGGETMGKREEFFALTAACRERGLSCAANTNATLIDKQTVEDLLLRGPRYLVLSIDSHRPDVHDWIRGVRGTWEQAVATLDRLVAAQAAYGSDIRVMTNTIVMERNLSSVGATARFLLDRGVSTLLFQALSPTFAFRGKRDQFFERQVPRDVSLVDAAVDDLLYLKREGAPIGTTENDLNWMKLYFRNPLFIGEQVCGSGEKNLIVDHTGDVSLCFSMRSVTKGRVLGNVRQSSLRSLWESLFAEEARAMMSACRRSCGMLNCHRKSP